MSYTMTREQAATALSISTRTIDRYIKRGKISYKKIANKVLLSDDDLAGLRDEFSLLRQEAVDPEVVFEAKKQESWQGSSSAITTTAAIDKLIDQKIERFFSIFNEKENTIREKDKVIFILQQRIGELESKMHSMIALPDYSTEKQSMLLEKQKLEDKVSQLEGSVKTEKTKSLVSLGMLLVAILIALAIALLQKM